MEEHKRRRAADWLPEYLPSHGMGSSASDATTTVVNRVTRISSALLLQVSGDG